MNVVNGVLAGCEYLYIFIERWNELSDKIVNCSLFNWSVGHMVMNVSPQISTMSDGAAVLVLILFR